MPWFRSLHWQRRCSEYGLRVACLAAEQCFLQDLHCFSDICANPAATCSRLVRRCYQSVVCVWQELTSDRWQLIVVDRGKKKGSPFDNWIHYLLGVCVVPVFIVSVSFWIECVVNVLRTPSHLMFGLCWVVVFVQSHMYTISKHIGMLLYLNSLSWAVGHKISSHFDSESRDALARI